MNRSLSAFRGTENQNGYDYSRLSGIKLDVKNERIWKIFRILGYYLHTS